MNGITPVRRPTPPMTAHRPTNSSMTTRAMRTRLCFILLLLLSSWRRGLVNSFQRAHSPLQLLFVVVAGMYQQHWRLSMFEYIRSDASIEPAFESSTTVCRHHSKMIWL